MGKMQYGDCETEKLKMVKSMEHNYLEEALSFYDIKESDVTLLRHNENLTYRIGTDYLLQIHEHIDGFYTDYLYKGLDRVAVYKTEIAFLEHLKKQGIIIRETVANCYGEQMSKLKDGTLVTVSKWIDGEALNNLELNDELCYQIGELTGRLHRCA